ncbi:MAG: ABC transporter substrate-binding protein, partial [Candidatus Omnitrophica bacterium]|nr:ABC transporter substrate-binding protein [Candidatus Omnitrophota bacterium]
TTINLEKIMLLNPDCIFATGLEQMMNVNKLEKIGLKVVVISPSNVSQTIRSIEMIGKITGKDKESGKLIKTMEVRLVKIREKIESIPMDNRPKVLVGISLSPLITAGSDSLVDDLIKLAGGRNIAYDAARSYAQFSIEKIIERNPDIIILGISHADEKDWKDFFKRDEFKDLTCVRQGRIYNVNPDIIFRPSQRLVEGIEKLNELFYPVN